MPANKNNSYHTLSKDLSERIEQDRANHWVNPYACPDSAIIRRFNDHDKPHLWRPAFVMDVEKILHNNYGSIIFFVGLTLPRYSFSKPSASLDRNLRQCLW